MRLIVGLGNPTEEYQKTRHNVGYMSIDHYAKNKSISFRLKKEFKGEIYLGKDYILLKPTTFMNLSGESVYAVSHYYKIDSKDIMIISDDFNIPFLKLRLREKGSAGGHNGLKSIIQNLGTQEFNRLRIGLGAPNEEIIDYVLSAFSKDDLIKLNDLFEKTDAIIDEFISGKIFDSIMNKYNINEPNN